MGNRFKVLNRLGLLVLIVALMGGSLSATTVTAEAADLSQFRPGNIISDSLFFNSATMTEGSIQNFLNSKVTTCASGYVCLKDYRETTTTRAANAMCSAYTGAASESAAQIIQRVGQACGINPQVLIVTLQKENSLVTRTSPTSGSYQTAMGYACPDTAACDSEYFGFFNQVYSAARQFKRYGNPPGTSNFFTWYPVGQVTNVQFHPNSACGSSPVLIENKATAALYYYTPYQPNQAALNAGYSASSDPCSAYGNRNFFQYFSDWFGSPYSPGESAIVTAYTISGGASGPLGEATTGYSTITANGGGMVRGYTNGAIAWSAARGAFILSGDVRTYFNENGGIGGPLGWPTSNATSYQDRGIVQGFAGGAIVHTAEHGFSTLTGTIRAAYGAAGGLTGPLGWPTGPQVCVSGSNCSQPFEGGILSQAGSTTTIISPAIEQAHAAGGGESGPLGAATSSVGVLLVNGGGLVRGFTNAAIAWSPGNGAHVVQGDVRAQLGAAGGVAGYLGWPTTDEVCSAGQCSQTFTGGTITTGPGGASNTVSAIISAAYEARGGATGPLGAIAGGTITIAANGGGLVNVFQNGALAASTSAGTVAALYEPIRSAFNATGGLGGYVGWPLTDARTEPANGGGLVQGFQNAAITSRPDTGTLVLSGPIRTYYSTVGGLAGSLGWPFSNVAKVTVNGGGQVQGFQNGAVVYRSSTGAVSLTGDIRTKFGEAGGLAGALGWPTGAARNEAANGGGVVQGFQGGAITYTSQAGAVLLTGDFRTQYSAEGGLAGRLGWPAGDVSCNASQGLCSQEFQNGFIDKLTGQPASTRMK